MSNHRTPGDYIGIGLAVVIVGALACLFVAGITETPEVLWACLLPALIGGIVMQIGVVAWGVSVGIRVANEGRVDRQAIGAHR